MPVLNSICNPKPAQFFSQILIQKHTPALTQTLIPVNGSVLNHLHMPVLISMSEQITA